MTRIATILFATVLSACGADTVRNAPAPERSAPQATSAPQPVRALQEPNAARVNAVADAYYAAVLAEQPEQAYFSGIELPRHDGLTDNSPAWLAGWQKREDAWLASLSAVYGESLVGTPVWITHGVLKEQLEASTQLRVCHTEWWQGVNHMGSWHTGLATVAERQPVDTPEHRAQALTRWAKLPAFIHQEIANLREGLAHGYSAAKPVAERMLKQVDGLIPPDTAAPERGAEAATAAALKDHPYAAPANAAKDDAAFSAAYMALLKDQVLPAIREYRAFLNDEYIPKARTALAVTALPDGPACYQAMLRANTTLTRSPQKVFDLGKSVVAGNMGRVRALGKPVFGTSDFAAIIKRVKEAKDNEYADPKDLLPASREMVTRAAAAMPRFFDPVPPQAVVVEPIPEYEDGGGASSHYEPPSADRPGTYRISMLKPGGTQRGDAEITAFHETWPGHHLQIAYAQRVVGLHPVMNLLYNSGYVEGWARYAEELSEEAGLYQTDFAKINRRAWPARGMVVDPGLHAFGWTREQAIAYLIESGRFDAKSAPSAVDRIAAIPGQLTAYDSGAQEFFALRREAEQALGTKFDLKKFHDAALGSGSLTLPMLRQQVTRWIEAQPR